MFTNISLSIGGNSFSFHAPAFSLDQIMPLIDRWFLALPNDGDQARLDALVQRLRQQNDGLETVVNAHLGITSAHPQE